jgi:hypothetical protein
MSSVHSGINSTAGNGEKLRFDQLRLNHEFVQLIENLQ